MKLEDVVGTKLTRERISPLDRRHPACDQWRRIFLLQLRNFGAIAPAALASGLTPTEVRKTQASDEEFADSIREAIIDIGEILEGEVFRRAMNGSDLLLMFAMKRHNPAYRDSAPVTSNNVTVVKTYIGFNPDMWDQVKTQDSVKIIDGEVNVLPSSTAQIEQQRENVSRETSREESDEQAIDTGTTK